MESQLQRVLDENQKLRDELASLRTTTDKPTNTRELEAYQKLRNLLWQQNRNGDGVRVHWEKAQVPIWSILQNYLLPEGVDDDDFGVSESEEGSDDEDAEDEALDVDDTIEQDEEKAVSTLSPAEPDSTPQAIRVFRHDELDLVIQYPRKCVPDRFEEDEFQFINLCNAMDPDTDAAINRIMPCRYARILSRKCYFLLEKIIRDEIKRVGRDRANMDHRIESKSGPSQTKKRLGDDNLELDDGPERKRARTRPNIGLSLPQEENARYFILTGQPGVGKSVFVIWLLITRLLNGEPTILRTKKGAHYHFTADSCRYIGDISTVLNADHSNRDIWYIADGGIHDVVEEGKTHNWVVLLVSSPKEEVWASVVKHNAGYCHMLYMPEWTWAETFATAVYVENLIAPEIKDTWRKFVLYGPVSRTLFKELGPWEDLSRQAELEASYRKKVYKKLRTMIRADEEVWVGQGWNDRDSHTVILTKVTNAAYTRTRREVITPWVGCCFARFDRDRRENGKKSLFFSLESVRKAATLRGHIFEDIFHQLCESERTLEILNIGNKSQADYVVKDFKIFNRLSDLQALVKNPQPYARSCNPDILDIYLRPRISNFGSIDSLMVTQTAVLLFQITCARSHPVSANGLEALWTTMPAYVKNRKWVLVFVCPEGDAARRFTAQLLTGDEKLVEKWNKKLEPQAMIIVLDEAIRPGRS